LSATVSEKCPVAQKIVKNPMFDLFFGVMILVSSAIMGVEINYRAIHHETPDVFKSISLIFCMVYAVELCLRVVASPILFFYWTQLCFELV